MIFFYHIHLQTRVPIRIVEQVLFVMVASANVAQQFVHLLQLMYVMLELANVAQLESVLMIQPFQSVWNLKLLPLQQLEVQQLHVRYFLTVLTTLIGS